jgi:DNA mismatch repair protein MutS
MGSRLLRNWLIRPLQKVDEINRRLDAIADLVVSSRMRSTLRDIQRQVGDVERLLTRICLGRASPRDVAQLKQSLLQIPEIKSILEQAESPALLECRSTLRAFPDTVELIDRTLVDDPPATVGAGGVIRAGVSEELDDLRHIATSGKEWLAKLQVEESERTGIPSLKVGYNKVFGYYIEVTHTHKERVPPEYIRKQTLVSAERYVTPALKEYEEKILTAEERMADLESELFSQLIARIAGDASELQGSARILATLDVFQSLADVAERREYVRPEVHSGDALEIVDGRHPVVEAALPPGDPFIPNSVALHPETEQIMIITGPNMAGKSVVLRQTGLIVLMAQIGSFVPASSASVGVVDKIFTRVGASDNLAAGESTFLVEMNETANILNNATSRSLILFDEVGRGTSTFDGISIAWAIVEYLHEHTELAARTLFATHYHELNLLADRFDRIVNFRIQVHEHGGKVVFLRKLVPGGADHSYGIEVARMAGLPDAVIGRARQILEHLETQKLSLDESSAGGMPRLKRTGAALDSVSNVDFSQLSMFSVDPDSLRVLRELEKVDPEQMTPIEALMHLARLKEILSGQS